MCTVTYVPTANGYYLTSNRDEKVSRKKAILPTEYYKNGISLIFPKDADAGGTWIALKDNGDSICLLNGAFENFTPNKIYTLSRGKIVTQLAISNNIVSGFNNISLTKTAPFTLIIINNAKLFECKWDGELKHVKELCSASTHIWSSATLYNKNQQQLRQKWFNEWVAKNPLPSLYNIFSFHKNTGEGNSHYDLVMNRENKTFTVSITGISVTADASIMQYMDLLTNEYKTVAFAKQTQLS